MNSPSSGGQARPKRRHQAAERAALGDRRVADLVSGRSRTVLVAPNLGGRPVDGKDADVVVGVYDYDQNRTVMALVDSKGPEVLAVEVLPVQLQLSAEERSEAEELTAGDSRVQQFLAGRAMNPLTRLSFPPAATGRDAEHRHAVVFVRPDTSQRRFVVVDLSARSVLGVFDAPASAAQ